MQSSTALPTLEFRKFPALRTDLAFTRGNYDWKIPEGSEGALGFLAYHSADEHIEFDFLSGGCSLSEDIFDDVWHRVKSSNYDHCRINIEVGPAALDYEEALWDRTALQSEWRYCACEPCGPAWFPQGSLVPQGLGWPRSRRPMAVVRLHRSAWGS